MIMIIAEKNVNELLFREVIHKNRHSLNKLQFLSTLFYSQLLNNDDNIDTQNTIHCDTW